MFEVKRETQLSHPQPIFHMANQKPVRMGWGAQIKPSFSCEAAVVLCDVLDLSPFIG